MKNILYKISKSYLLFQKKGEENIYNDFSIGKVIEINNIIQALKYKIINLSIIYNFLIGIIFNNKYKICILLNDNKEIIHFSHYSNRGIKYKNIFKNDIVIGPCWTREDFRGRNIYPTILKYISNNNSFNYYIFCEKNNIASQRGIIKAGFKEVGTVEKMKIGHFITRYIFKHTVK